MTGSSFAAVDLGAESGRVMAVHFDGGELKLEELHRFPNGAVEVHGTLYWDFLQLWSEIQAGIEHGKGHGPASIGVDTWGVDFGLRFFFAGLASFASRRARVCRLCRRRMF